MQSRPKLLDLFCGAGGCSMGYHQAGFEVVGVDINPQPHYPFELHQCDWQEYLNEHWREFSAIHASPPCQGYSVTNNVHKKEHPLLIEEVRSRLCATGLPYVIENVVGAPMESPILLRGNMFGLKVKRDRLFESNCLILAPQRKKMEGWAGNSWGHRRDRPIQRNPSLFKGECDFVTVAGHGFLVEEARFAMGIDWMNSKEIAQAIPPAYTEWIGQQLLMFLPENVFA